MWQTSGNDSTNLLAIKANNLVLLCSDLTRSGVADLHGPRFDAEGKPSGLSFQL